ncbi:hypothetical protein L873DRAFT_1803267 [Choiromyces venosus 120613-1]|uniref:Uncharacterized protein n=1 Tax=Choiromyces venosus 120613-1 TaxID=1336337 RepID=A0A3N4K6K9_9PEZI|nr:hypothetical protein L873DRAFT_1803267 [Choiromyces venosus 120613-1]
MFFMIRFTLLALFAIPLITVLATPLTAPTEDKVDSLPVPGFKGRFRVEPPAGMDTNIYQIFENGTQVVVFNPTAPTSSDEPITFDIGCDTTDGSPNILNVREAARRLEDYSPEHCTQNNPFGSKCTRWITEGDADLAVCGEFRYSVHCDFLGWSARQIVARCSWKEYAGGKFIWGSHLKGIVY